MTMFLEEKFAVLEAFQRTRKRVRLAAMAGVALLAAIPITGAVWLAIPAIVALVTALLLQAVVQNLRSRTASSTPASARTGRAEGSANPKLHSNQSGHVLPEPAGPVVEDWVTLSHGISEPLRFKTQSDEDVTLTAGRREVAFRFSFAPERAGQEPDAIDYPVCDLRFRDDDGKWWKASTFLDPYTLTRPLETAARGIHFWQDAPSAWKEALQTSCLIAGVQSLLDSRDRIELPVGDRSVTMMFKYQGPEIDLGWSETEGKLVVRVGKMYYELCKDDARDDIVDQVTFGYLLDPADILLPTSPDAHWIHWNQWEEDVGEERQLPVVYEMQPDTNLHEDNAHPGAMDRERDA